MRESPAMGESPAKGRVTFDESHVNIKLPNRCRRCHTYNEDPDAPTMRESFVILLNQMTRRPRDVCFLATMLLPYAALTGVSVLLLLLAGYSNTATALFYSVILLFLVWFFVIKHFGRRYAQIYSTEQDLLSLNAVNVA